jgi:hypothetical protein
MSIFNIDPVSGTPVTLGGQVYDIQGGSSGLSIDTGNLIPTVPPATNSGALSTINNIGSGLVSLVKSGADIYSAVTTKPAIQTTVPPQIIYTNQVPLGSQVGSGLQPTAGSNVIMLPGTTSTQGTQSIIGNLSGISIIVIVIILVVLLFMRGAK